METAIIIILVLIVISGSGSTPRPLTGKPVGPGQSDPPGYKK